MLYPVCPSCQMLLADKEIPFEEGMEKICKNKQLSDSEKKKQKEKLLNDIGCERYCCRMRMISYLDQSKLII